MEEIDEQPLVSILMTAYNRQQFIAEAIEHVLAINYKNWELIIVDDSSIDSTLEIAQSFQKKEKRVRVYQNERNIGDYPNRNKAAGYAQGKYIVYADSDDRMYPDSLKKWVTEMEKYYCSFGIFSHTGNEEIFILEPEKLMQLHFFNRPILNFGPVATIITNKYFQEINAFPVKYGPANDMYYNLKAASQTRTIVFPFPITDYRIHEGQELNNPDAYLYNSYLYLRDALNELNLSLSHKQVAFLSKKNKRRFLTNVLKYYCTKRNWEKTSNAVRISGFTIKDAIEAIIH
jgi:glycosyltransferase involved in cell wall biosynthesis